MRGAFPLKTNNYIALSLKHSAPKNDGYAAVFFIE